MSANSNSKDRGEYLRPVVEPVPIEVYARERDTEVRNGETFRAGESVRQPDSSTCWVRKAVVETESANQATGTRLERCF